MNEISPIDCCCGGEGQHFCRDISDKHGREGYVVACEDCDNCSPTAETMHESTKLWNKMIAKINENNNQ